MVDNDVALVMSSKYMQRIRFTLNSIGTWPNKHFGDLSRKSRMLQSYNYFVITKAFFGTAFVGLFIKNHFRILSFIDLGQAYVTFLLGIIFVVRLTLPLQKPYCTIVKEFVSKFHIMHHKDMSDFSMKTYTHVEKICGIATIICHFQMYIGFFLFNIVPVVNNYKNGMYSSNKPVNGSYEHSLSHDLPFDHYHDPFYYWIMLFVNFYMSYNCICTICCIDLLLCLIVLHIWGHLSMLQHDCHVFPRPTYDGSNESSLFTYSEEESKDVTRRLNDLLKRHNMVKEFLSKTSSAFSTSLCVYYAFHQLAGCLLLLECSFLDPKALVRFGPLAFVMFQQLIQISVIFELIGTKGDTLNEAVYGLPWECMGAGDRRAVMLFLQNVQTPLALKAAEVVPVGVQTMSAILRRTWSYFLMLRTLQD